MENDTLKKIVVWDIVNWSRALKFWEENCLISDKDYNCLELGSSKGGLSLWLALNGNHVYCTDINGPEPVAHDIHSEYHCESRITYGRMDALHIPYKNHFDIIVFKSIMGGISFAAPQNKQIIINQIHKALKPNGRLLFAENLEATVFHKFFRGKYGTKKWNYLKIGEVDDIFSRFKKVNYITTGFWGCFGRSEWQRNFLGRIDHILDPFVSPQNKYIIIGQAIK